MKIIQFIALGAAAGLIVGCSSTSNEYTQTPNPPNQPSVDLSRNTSGTAGNTAYNYNEGSYVPGQSSQYTTIDQLPQPAQTTIRNQIGGQQITKIKMETKDGQTAYCVELQRASWHSPRPELVVAADGSILKERHLGTINEAAGAEAPSQYNTLGSTGTVPNPAPPTNPAAPTPAFPPSSVQSDR